MESLGGLLHVFFEGSRHSGGIMITTFYIYLPNTNIHRNLKDTSFSIALRC